MCLIQEQILIEYGNLIYNIEYGNLIYNIEYGNLIYNISNCVFCIV